MVGPTSPSLPSARELTADLTAPCIALARTSGVLLDAEADDANVPRVPALERIPSEGVRELLPLSDG
jgi:hypothetical protein